MSWIVFDDEATTDVRTPDGETVTSLVLTSGYGPKGDTGPQGVSGISARDVELGQSATHVQWRYVDEVAWTDLVPLTDITGPQGIQGATGATGATGAAGADGREVELQKSATHVQWRYVGDTTWTDVVLLVDITGPQGATGPQGVQGVQGPQGIQGIQGDTGPAGADGAAGPAGPGLPVGGNAGEVPIKLSGTDYDIGWGTVSGGGGGSLADSYQGEWLMATAYSVGDVVTYQSETWYGANSSTGVTPAHPETFTDEFDSGAADGRTWELASATRTWEMDSFVSVQSGQLKNIAAAAQKWARIDLGSQYDFEIVGRGAVELVLNYFDVSNNVLWDGGTTVAKRVGGIVTTVPIVGAAGSGGTDLRVQRRGDVYKFWRDSDLVGEINDATLDDTGGQKVGIKFDPLEAVNAVRARNGQTAWELLAGKGADGAAGPAGADGAAGPTGPAGADGVDGATGPAGADGVGLPPGGLTGQAAIKLSDADYDIGWGTVSGGGGGGSSYTRTTATHTTASLADDAREAATVTLAGAAAFRVYKVVADRACRVRIYTTTAKRDADLIRGIGTDPQGDHGLLLDVVFSSTLLSLELSPIVDAYLPGVAGTVPITVDNLSGATSPVQVTLTYVRSE